MAESTKRSAYAIAQRRRLDQRLARASTNESISASESNKPGAGSHSLLDFAIAASLAVLPVMLGVVWLVAVARPADPELEQRLGRTDRYASVRHIAALETFEPAIVERAGAAATAPTPADVLAGVPACGAQWGERSDVRRWLHGSFDKPVDAVAMAISATPKARLCRFCGLSRKNR